MNSIIISGSRASTNSGSPLYPVCISFTPQAAIIRLYLIQSTEGAILDQSDSVMEACFNVIQKDGFHKGLWALVSNGDCRFSPIDGLNRYSLWEACKNHGNTALYGALRSWSKYCTHHQISNSLHKCPHKLENAIVLDHAPSMFPYPLSFLAFQGGEI